MTKFQLIVVALSIILFSALYFGFGTKPGERAEIDRKRSLVAESTDINTLLNAAKENLTSSDAAELSLMENDASNASDDSVGFKALEKLSGWWYDQGRADIAGHFAEMLAETLGTEDAWSIAGTTFAICQQKSQEEKQRSFCSQHAVKAFENAISLNPSEVAHKVNLALIYTEQPPTDNPMKGVLMLVELNKEYPDNVLVLTNLGRLAIQTGQFDKAIERLQQALSFDADHPSANCLMAKALEGAGKELEAKQFLEKCQLLRLPSK